MNLLRNPWVTAVLAIIAVAVVWYQLFPPQRGYTPRPVETTPPTAATSTSPREVSPTLNLPTKNATPEVSIDRDYIQAHLMTWIAVPERDPFQLLVPRAAQGTNTATPWVRWKLYAIYRQNGSSLAAINQGIYSEGDVIDGYRVEKIEDGHVWLQGPKVRERLSFDNMEPDAEPIVPPSTNAITPPPEPVSTNSTNGQGQ
jgi:hypothetical protein